MPQKRSLYAGMCVNVCAESVYTRQNKNISQFFYARARSQTNVRKILVHG